MNKILFILLLTVPVLSAQSLPAQQTNTESADDHQLILKLLNQVQELQAEVNRLKGTALPAPPEPVPPPPAMAATVPEDHPGTAPPETHPDTNQDPDAHDHMMALPDGPALHIRGFFDIDFDDGAVAENLQYPLGVPAHSSFRAGEFDLFMTSQLSDRLSFLAECVFSSDQTNSFGVDLERFQLTYQQNQFFQISAGRYHSAIGYYNTAYHHGLWFSTATGRPFMYYWEDSGGVLPVHELGLTATGRVPGSGALNLHWIAEIGNGSAEFGSVNFGSGVQNFASDRNRKDVNFAVYSRPNWLPGLQAGGSYMRGSVLSLATGTMVYQNVSSAYVDS